MIREIVSCIRNLPRHLKSAIQNIWRNGAMSASSVYSVTITLVLIGAIGIIAVNIQDMTLNVQEGLKVYVKMEREATEEQTKGVEEQLKKIPHVTSVLFSSKDEEFAKLSQGFNGSVSDTFAQYKGDNPLGDAYYIEVDDAQYLREVATIINDIDYVNSTNYGGTSVTSLVNVLKTIRNTGAVFIIGLVVVALFMIANTIKITITSRQTEIAIMRMVGASNWYIRIPFMFEGMLIGILGSLIPITVLYFSYTALYNMYNGRFYSALLLLRSPFPFIWKLSYLLIALGSGVGLIGSFFSIRKYLRF